MNRIILFSFCFFLFFYKGNAQYNKPQNNVWITASHQYGIDFNSGAPQSIPNPGVLGFANSASVCDSNGVLQFFCQGRMVYTAAGNEMPHGNINYIYPTNTSIPQCIKALQIIPDPANAKRHYLFSQIDYDPGSSSGVTSRLFCDRIDMNLNNGLGDVDTTYYLHGVVIDDKIGINIYSIKGCENNVWLLTRDTTKVVKFKAYEITANGLNLNPVVSTTTFFTPGPNWPLSFTTVVSPDRNKLFFHDGLICATALFNKTTGMVSNMENFPIPYLPQTSILINGSFSPNSQYFYLDSFQYDMNNPNPILNRVNILGPYWCSMDMRLAPNGKIYGSPRPGINGTAAKLYCINAPDSFGTACNFGLATFGPLTITESNFKFIFPPEIQVPSYENYQNGTTYDTVVCKVPASGIMLHTTGSGIIWDNGSTAANRWVMQRGTYWVRHSTEKCFAKTDTFKIRGEDVLPLNISYNQPILSTTATYANYQWYKAGNIIVGATNQTYQTTDTGWFSVVVHNSWGCGDSVAYHIVGNGTGIGLFGNAQQIFIYPNPASTVLHINSPVKILAALYSIEGKCVKAAAMTTVIDIAALPKGMYLLKVMDMEGRLLKVEKVGKE